MKRQILIILALVLVTTGCARTAVIRRPTVSEASLVEIENPEPRFTVGERLTYFAAWKGIPIGSATATIEELTTFKGHEVYKIKVVATTNKFLSKLFPVKDIYTSYMDKSKLISRRYEASLREGRYKKDLVVDYDSKKNVATYTNLTDGSVKMCPTGKDVRDPICAAYYLRTIPLKLGDRIDIEMNLCVNNYEVIGDIAERVSVSIPKMGTFQAFLIRPYVKLHGVRQRRANAWGYLSADKKRIALFIVVRVLEIPWIGNVTATLQKIENIAPAQY